MFRSGVLLCSGIEGNAARNGRGTSAPARAERDWASSAQEGSQIEERRSFADIVEIEIEAFLEHLPGWRRLLRGHLEYLFNRAAGVRHIHLGKCWMDQEHEARFSQFFCDLEPFRRTHFLGKGFF